MIFFYDMGTHVHHPSLALDMLDSRKLHRHKTNLVIVILVPGSKYLLRRCLGWVQVQIPSEEVRLEPYRE